MPKTICSSRNRLTKSELKVYNANKLHLKKIQNDIKKLYNVKSIRDLGIASFTEARAGGKLYFKIYRTNCGIRKLIRYCVKNKIEHRYSRYSFLMLPASTYDFYIYL